MNFAHIHLLLNHIPVIGIPIVFIFLAYAIYTKNAATQKFSLWALFVLAAMVVPVYFTGEPAEDVIHNLPDFAESFVEPHEDAAMVSLIFTSLTGIAALFAL